MRALKALLTEIVDYAGLFPPAGLPMSAAVASYAAYRREPDAWMLGRFVVPAARLQEFADAIGALPAADLLGEPWRLSALGGPDIGLDLGRIAAFNQEHGVSLAKVDTIELKATNVQAIDGARATLPDWLTAYVELPIEDDPRPLLARLAALGLRAKVRSGGVTPDAFPAASDLARFIGGCVAAGLPFKATAGLHHPMRAAYRLTYTPDGPTGTMYGYLNVFLTAGFMRAGMGEADAVGLLLETDPAAFVFDGDGVMWRERRLDTNQLAEMRRELAISFGSCSFREPVEEGRAIGLFDQ
jgi:hypothetical protein